MIKKLIPPIFAELYRKLLPMLIYRDKTTSRYWQYLNRKNIKQLKAHGIGNYENTVGRNYYTFTSIIGEFQPVSKTIELLDIVKLQQHLTLVESINYNIILQYLIALAEKGHYEMPTNPTHETMASLFEYELITKFVAPQKIIEIGAGSGRTAKHFLSHIPNLLYTIIDIEPALTVARHNLIDYNVVYSLPGDIDQLPDKKYDLFMAVDCLHEMTKKQVKDYLYLAERMASYLYFKAWENTIVPFDNIKHNYKDFIRGKVLYDGPCPYPSTMREVICKLD